MFEHDEPVAPDLTIAVGNAYRPINQMTLLIGARDTLNAVTESEIAVHGDAEIRDGDFRCTLKMREEVLPILTIGVSTAKLLPGHDVENDETFIQMLILHHRVNVPGVEGGCKPILKRPHRSFIVR